MPSSVVLPFVRAMAAFAASKVLLPADARVLVALSGGPDSCALLMALCDAADAGLIAYRPVGVAHFHHGLRGSDADSDAAFSAALATRFGLPAVVGIGAVPAVPGQSPNDAARRARYDFLTEAAHDMGASVIATAHTADDQAETVLLRVLRGTGLDGLSGIPVSRLLDENLSVVRPLLGQTRADVETFCAARGVTPRRDPSNEKDRYARSRLRRRLPEIAEAFNPHLTESLVRLADTAAADAQLLNALAEDTWRVVVASTAPGLVRLRTVPLAAAPVALRRRVLLRAVRQVGRNTPTVEEAATAGFVRLLEDLLLNGRSGLNLPGAMEARVTDGLLILATPLPVFPVPSFAVPLTVPGRTRVAPARLWLSVRPRSPNKPSVRARRASVIDLSADALRGTMAAVRQETPLLVRDARPGDRIAPLGMHGKTRLVRDVMADAGWPERLRDGAPLVVRADTGTVLWVIGLIQAESTRVRPDTVAVWRMTAAWDC